jgi:hypothetical protein
MVAPELVISDWFISYSQTRLGISKDVFFWNLLLNVGDFHSFPFLKRLIVCINRGEKK